MGKKPKELGELQIAIDRLIATARSDQPPRDQDVQALIDSWGGDVYGETDHITVGVPVTSIELSCNDAELAASIDQNEITDALRIKFAREKLASECVGHDADISPGFRGAEIMSSNGQRAWVVFTITGYSFTDIDIELFGIFTDLEALTERMRKDSYVRADKIGDADDTVAWITDTQILKLWSR
jgi:hypothetical protein